MVVISHFKLYPALFPLKWLICIPNISAVRGKVVFEMLNDFYRTAIFWKQLFLYLKDGRYTIDNLSAERALRPLAVERNNSMFFCSHKGAETSVLYHTIIATCKKQGYKVLDYLKEFFKQIILGRCDYENLMPATIGISSINKC